MPPTFHYLSFRTLAHATEDVDRVKAALRYVLGVDAEIHEEAAEGHYKNPIRILTAELKRNPDIDAFFRRVAAEGDLLDTIIRQMDLRLDENQLFYLRFGKQDAFMERLALSREEDAVQVRGKVAAFPAKRDRARANLEAYLTGLKPDARG